MNDEKYIFFSRGKILAAVKEVGYIRNPNHNYFELLPTPIEGMMTEIGNIIIDKYLLTTKAKRKKIKTDLNTYSISFGDRNQFISKPINYKTLMNEIKVNCRFDIEKFGLPEIDCFWLDTSVDVSMNFHMHESGTNPLSIQDGTTTKQFGDKYPFKPILEREGHFFSTFQPTLVERILEKRLEIVSKSNNALNSSWIFDLKDLVNNTISLLDINLIQIYIKAEFDKKENWNFDSEILGTRISRSISDKLEWIYKITGNNLNLEREKESINRLRKLRNHLNHFDPPTFQITLEEIETILNDIPIIGLILHKIRICINEPTPTFLINLMCQNKIKFQPEAAFTKRTTLDKNKSGFDSCQW